MPLHDKYITLTDQCSLRHLEMPCVYNKVTDELYELGTDAFEFLKLCDGTRTAGEVGGDPEFVSYCIGEGILAALPRPYKRYINIGTPSDASLRYMELHLTTNCNLRCRHCYLSAGAGEDMEFATVFRVFEEFDSMQGLRMLLSVGEPLLHRGFWYINERLQGYGFRSILLTNGTLITKDMAARLKVHEAQVSIDGMMTSHDLLRGDGTFKRAVKGIELLTEAGIKVSAATMITALNRADFDEMQMLMESLGVAEWSVDVPSFTGRFKENPGLLLSAEEAAPYMSYGYGGGHHGGVDGYACGTHLCAVGVGGQVAKCGFYLNSPVGNISEGLGSNWDKIERVRLERLDCDCEHIDICKGGCRFRAESYTHAYGPDPVKCSCYGVTSSRVKGGGKGDYNESREVFRKCV